MKFAENLKKYREIESISQEELAEKIFVSRQTISNWENNKSYPDVNSLALLSKTFNTSIDNLIKGDIEIMKEKINQIDIDRFNRLSLLYNIFLIAIIFTPIPLIHFLGLWGFVIYGIIAILGLAVAISVERMKKRIIFILIEKLWLLQKVKSWMKYHRQEKMVKEYIKRLYFVLYWQFLQ